MVTWREYPPAQRVTVSALDVIPEGNRSTGETEKATESSA
jgi:hypothetical protein